MLTAIVGINWGDEGKGRMVDLLSEKYDIVSRYQGGNNAGHTVVNEKGKFILNLLPSGILRDETVNIMGPGMVIDVEHLFGEVQRLRDAGIEITPEHLKISDRATICMPYHKLLDCLEEDRLGDAKFGSTRRGISPVYADKYMKKALRMGDLLHMDDTKKRLPAIVEWKNLTIEKGYGHEPISSDEMVAGIISATRQNILKMQSQTARTYCLRRSSAHFATLISVSILTRPHLRQFPHMLRSAREFLQRSSIRPSV